MATKIQYLTYYIHLTDATQVAAYQAQYPQGVNRAIYNPNVGGTGLPGGAAVEFNAPFKGYTQPAAGTAPFIWTPWSGYGSQGGPYPLSDATFQRHTGGFLGIGGTTTRYYWMGQFVYAAPPAAPTQGAIPVPVVVPVAQRRMVEGFEVPGMCFGATNNLRATAAAARSVGGLGLAIRDSAFNTFSITSIGLLNTDRSDGWDRFYVRVNALPPASVGIWRCNAWPTSSNGAALTVLPSGELAVENLSSGPTRALLGTVGALGLDTWAKVDVLYEWNTLASNGQGRIRVWLNGVLRGTFTVLAAAGGFGTNSQTQQSIQIGNVHALSGAFSIDLDDYVSAEVPKLAAVEDLRGQDWLNGSKVVIARATGHASAHSGWTGDFRIATQTIQGTYSSEQNYTSSVSGATLAVTTNAERWAAADPGALGVAAIQVGLTSTRGAASGQLGYRLAGGSAVLSAITQSAAGALNPNFVMYRPSGVLPPAWPVITPLELHHTKGTGADAAVARYLAAQIELIGVFQPEDFRATEATGTAPTFPDRRMIPWHRWSPRSPWAIGARSGPIAPYIIFAGSYTGNSTGQDLLFRSPVQFLFIRRTSGSSPENGLWFATMLAPHVGGRQGIRPHTMTAALEDLTFVPADGQDVQQQRYMVRFVGSDAETNASGSTYQYIAISDPGMRFLCGTDFAEQTGQGDITHPLPNPNFLPELTLLQIREDISTTSTLRLGVKGTGHATATIQQNTALLTSAMDHQTGSLLTHVALHAVLGGEHTAAFCLRHADGNNDPNQAAALTIGTYVGDGVASRSLTVGTAGKRPLFAMCWPDTGPCHYRDPAHTSTNCSDIDGGALITTGFTAGAVDGFTVGAALNSNAVVHHYWVLWAADNVAGNGGWGTNPASGEIAPVEANSPADGPWPADPTEPVAVVTPPVVIPGEPDLDSTTALPGTAEHCEFYSRRLVNIALSHIGVSKQVVNLNTDATEEATLARLHLKEDVEATLRDFPWPFATRYADLVLVAGTATVPATKDWQYSYRAPTSMLFARRIVGQADQRRAYDAAPIQFREGSDANGALLYSDAVASTATPVTLEYTIRMTCPAYQGDPLFRAALAWRLAHSLAPALSKDSKKQAYCWAMYVQALVTAETAAANETQQPPAGDVDWISGRN